MAEVSNGDATVEQPANLVEGILHLTGWTQTRLVHELRRTARLLQEPEPTGLQLVTVNRWKQGRQSPSAYYRRLLRCLYVATYRESAARRDRAWREGDRSEARIDEVDEMRRRQFLVYTAALSCSVALDPEQLVASLQRGTGADARLVDQVTASVQGHARRWYSMPPESLWPLVRGELTAVNELRIGAAGSIVGRRLASLTGEVAALAGWLAWLCGNRDTAEAYYTFAQSLAGEEAGRGRARVRAGAEELPALAPLPARGRGGAALADAPARGRGPGALVLLAVPARVRADAQGRGVGQRRRPRRLDLGRRRP